MEEVGVAPGKRLWLSELLQHHSQHIGGFARQAQVKVFKMAEL
jgi:hypothetical protein